MLFRTRIPTIGVAMTCLSLLAACAPSVGLQAPALITGGGAPGAIVPAAAAVACPGEGARDIGDIDGDRVADPVVVTFGPNGGGPAYLDVHNSSAAEQVIGGADVGIPGVASLGYSTLVLDVNRDGCADVVTVGEGGVYLIPGSVDGLLPGAAKRLSPPRGADDWGQSIAVLKNRRLLAVGSPFAPSSPHRGGAVYLYPLANDGTPGKPTVLTQDSRGVPGASETGDRFGSTLASDGNLLAIGAPGEATAGRSSSGAVTLVKFTGVGLAFNALRWTQNSAGFETSAEANDELGATLAVRGNFVAMGVPDEDLAGAQETGIAHVVELTSATKPKLKKVDNLHQNSAGIPGVNETNDRWGSAVAFAANVGCTPLSVVIGAHGDKLGKAPSGAVTLVGLGKRCASRWLPKETFGVSFRYFGRQIVTLSSAAGGSAPDVVLVGDAFSRAIGDSVYETGQVVAVTTVSKGKWTATALPPRDGYHAYSNYGQGLGLAGHG